MLIGEPMSDQQWGLPEVRSLTSQAPLASPCFRVAHLQSEVGTKDLSQERKGTYNAGGNYRIHDLFGEAWKFRICSVFFYLKYFGTPKYQNTLGRFSPSLCFSANRKLPKLFGSPRIQEYLMYIFLFAWSIPRNISGNNFQRHGKHKYFWPVTPPIIRGSPDREARGQSFMYYPRNPRNINLFVRVPDREDRWPRRPENFMCKSFMCLFCSLEIFKSRKNQE